jgi:hypothetical protein
MKLIEIYTNWYVKKKTPRYPNDTLPKFISLTFPIRSPNYTSIRLVSSTRIIQQEMAMKIRVYHMNHGTWELANLKMLMSRSPNVSILRYTALLLE